jgi:AcrR family transcriptional regulator
MSPRRADPQLPLAIVEAAATLLVEGGPAALTARRLSAAVGRSTMAVYSHFHGMDDVVRAMVHEGFDRLYRRLSQVAVTADPVADIVALGYAYRRNATEFPDLYRVMFGTSSLAGFALSDEDRQAGRYTLRFLIDAVDRATAAGRFAPGDAEQVAQQLWIALHGLVVLELGGYLIAPFDAETCHQGQIQALLAALGDEPESVRASVDCGRNRHLAGAAAGAAPATA